VHLQISPLVRFHIYTLFIHSKLFTAPQCTVEDSFIPIEPECGPEILAAFDGYICAQAVALADTLRKPAMICNVTFTALNSIKQPRDLFYWANVGF